MLYPESPLHPPVSLPPRALSLFLTICRTRTAHSCGTTGCLFNVTADPTESHDLASELPDDLDRLRSLVAEAKQTMYEQDPGPQQQKRFLLTA